MMTTLANLQPQTGIFILHILILHIHMHARKCNRKKYKKHERVQGDLQRHGIKRFEKNT